ncbi:MAG: ABC transporter ATP-binding protein [bacterium]
MVKISNLYKSFGEIEVLKGVELEIKNAEIVAIVGASGVGKSTLLHIIGGIEKPSSGNVLFNNCDIFALKEDNLNRFRAKNMGFILQFYNLFSNLSIFENVLIPSLIMGNNASKRAYELISFLGLSSKINHLPNHLSFGEQQRVAIARALINSPEIIIADEPTGSLDKNMAIEVYEMLKSMVKRENKALIIATHNEELSKMADRLFRLSDGQLR